MTRQLRAEITKVFSLRLTWGLVLLAGCYVGVNAILLGFLTGRDQLAGSDIGLSATEAANAVYGQALSAYIFALVAGIMMITGEFRHGTASTTFMIQPRRRVVVAAKLLASLLLGFAFAVAGAVVTLATGLPVLALRGYASLIPASDVAMALLGGMLAVTLYGAMGVGIGSLVRNQVAAIVGSLVLFLLVGDLLAGLVPEVGRWLPNGAASAMARLGSLQGQLLEPWAGAVVFVAWAVGLAVVGSLTTMRRDV